MNLNRLSLGIIFLLGLNAEAFQFQSYETEVGLDYPAYWGAHVKAVVDESFYGVLGVGYTPNAFADGINSMAKTVGAAGNNTGAVINQALSGSFVFNASAGWNLANIKGMYIEVGYMLMTGGSGPTDVETLEAAFGQDYHANPLALNTTSQMKISSTLHCLTAHTGFRWQIFDNAILNADLGVIKPLISSSTLNLDDVNPNTTLANDVAQALKKETEDSLKDAYLSEFWFPTVGLWVSFFF